MLRVDLRELGLGPVDTRGELGQADPLLAGLDVALREPVAVGGRLQATGEGRFYWHGTLRTVMAAECRRCLTPITVPVTAQIGALFTQDADALEDPDSYPLPPDATEIDLTPAVREELILAVPQYVLCREDCRGLCPRCGEDLNAGPCGCAPAADLRWQALQALKGKPRD
ncbi:MAG TPA: DUF177 domain-containing protein [Gemmatimonadales bacterium]|nr:DUF177 domain-containing protein [Gemmatimonadales bacterium]